MKKLYIDIGGSNLRSELHGEGETVSQTISSEHHPLMAFIEGQMADAPDIGFIGISYAGQVHRGRILSAPNIVVDESEIVQTLTSRYGIRVEIENDLNCAVMAEAAYWGEGSVAALYVGTGIGAASIDASRLVRGGGNLANEIGHIPYRRAPFRCGCGRDNCIELFASGSGMAKWLRHYGSDLHPDLQRLKGSMQEEERQVAEEFEKALLQAAGTLVTMANPDLLVLGGGIVERNPYLLDLLRERLEGFALKPSLEALRIEISRLENGPLEGAKLLEEKHYG